MMGSAHLFGTVLLLGVLHGISPEHGWPLAVAYALRSPRKILTGIVGGAILGFGHLISSLAVVLVFILLGRYLTSSVAVMKLLAGILLILLGIRELFHAHPHSSFPNASTVEQKVERWKGRGFLYLFGFAILLGFVHEEEFQILGICAGESQHCLLLMGIYAGAVLSALVATTTLVLTTTQLLPLRRLEPYLPFIAAVILIVTGIRFLLS